MYRRILYALLAVALLAALFVTERRAVRERAAANVEIVMDDAEFANFARAFGLDQARLLAQLHAAGMTSLAVTEEIGAGIPASGHATVVAGGALIDQAHLAALGDPLLAGLVQHGVRDDEFYLIAYDAPTARRYAEQLPLKFGAGTFRTLRAALPAVWAIRTQSDYLGFVGFGLAADRVALAHAAGLHVAPRLQNDQAFTDAQIEALVDSATRGGDATTAIFFGPRNEVLGFPERLSTAARAMRHAGLNFGSVEVYDIKTLQSGNDDLARRLPDRVVRVQAIGKSDQSSLRAEDIVARMLLGVRERNIRVVFLRPYTHPWGDRDVAAANVELVARIADGVRRAGLHLGPAHGFDGMDIRVRVIVPISLAVPAIALLILAALGIESVPLAIAFVLADLLLLVLGYQLHHDVLARKLLALAAGVLFPTAGLLALGWAFRGEARPAAWLPPIANRYLRGLAALCIATVVTLGGALVIVGILSTPLTMTETDRFLGVKYVLALPALAALALYFFTDRFNAKIDPATWLDAPVRIAQLLVGAGLVAGAIVIVERSGNTGDITPSAYELALRSQLTDLLQVRPRFKEVLLGFPALMLVPALHAADLRRWGWLIAVAIGLGLGDVVDTFAHLHTALPIGAIRVINGAVFGGALGALAIAVYGRLRLR